MAFDSMPGPSTVLTAQQRRIFRGYPSQLQLFGCAIKSTSTDASNTVTTDLRTGLTMAQITGTKLFVPYAPTATDGSQIPAGILWEDVGMLNEVGVAEQKQGKLIVGGGPVIAANVINIDPRVRQTLGQFIYFDDRFPNEPPGFLGPIAKAADYQLVSADSGYEFHATAAVNFTLPATIQAGFRVRIAQEADANLTITAAAGKLIIFNNAAATSGAFSTAGNKIAAVAEVMAIEDATKYLFVQLCKHTLTVA